MGSIDDLWEAEKAVFGALFVFYPMVLAVFDTLFSLGLQLSWTELIIVFALGILLADSTVDNEIDQEQIEEIVENTVSERTEIRLEVVDE